MLKYPSFIVDRDTVLGNPYHIGSDGTRKEVIEKYKKYFYDTALNTPCIKAKLDEIFRVFLKSDINLVCHCNPLDCHARIIKEYLEEQYIQQKALNNV